MTTTLKQVNKEKDQGVIKKLTTNIKKHPTLYLMAIPILLYYIIFKYIPMYGIIISFQKFVPAKGILDSKWIGLTNYINFFKDPYFFRIVKNTFLLNFYNLLFGFPIPIVFALMLNELKNVKCKKLVQTITYMPHFISTMIVCSLVVRFVRSDGVITYLITLLGGEAKNYLGIAEAFPVIFTVMNIWQEFGWGSIIYIAALTAIDPTLYEAAAIDGAGRLRKIMNITLPLLMPTVVTLLILRIGKMMTLGFEKIILLYSPLIYETADVISSYVYRKGIVQNDYSYSTAVGVFNSVINLVLLIIVNKISKKVNETSIW